jgi:hypothetical protein
MNLAKSLIVSKKQLFYSSRTYAVKWQFLAKNQSKFCLPASLIDPILSNESMLADSI